MPLSQYLALPRFLRTRNLFAASLVFLCFALATINTIFLHVPPVQVSWDAGDTKRPNTRIGLPSEVVSDADFNCRMRQLHVPRAAEFQAGQSGRGCAAVGRYRSLDADIAARLNASFHGDLPPLRNHSSAKLVLFWNSPRLIYNWVNASDLPTFGGCAQPCRATNDRSEVGHADAVIVGDEQQPLGAWPASKPPGQRWILSMDESPLFKLVQFHRGQKLRMSAHIDWLMSYRVDSDIYRPYGFWQWRREPESAHEEARRREKIAAKRRQAAWFVSHCKTASRREDLALELRRQGVRLDVAGRCPRYRNTRLPPGFDDIAWMDREHLFYLAFENAHCRDYITEKFWDTLAIDVVPVVLGGASSVDYRRVAPPHSYVDARDFATPARLADHLQYLDKNRTAYSEYFNWKRDREVRRGWDQLSHRKIAFRDPALWCQLCEKLHEGGEGGNTDIARMPNSDDRQHRTSTANAGSRYTPESRGSLLKEVTAVGRGSSTDPWWMRPADVRGQHRRAATETLQSAPVSTDRPKGPYWLDEFVSVERQCHPYLFGQLRHVASLGIQDWVNAGRIK